MVTNSLVLATILFLIGALGVVIRRNAIILFLCVELMLSAVSLAFVALSRVVGIEGQVYVFFIMAVAAAEAAVGLAIVISIFRHAESVDLKNFNLLRW
jgi:NADH-quinone oxidoreductase subunit K